MAEKELGANIHASIDGTVKDVTRNRTLKFTRKDNANSIWRQVILLA